MEHLCINLVSNIALIHHHDVAHAVFSMLGNVMITKLRDQFEQKGRAFFVIDLRLFAQFLYNDLFRVVSLKINRISLDALSIIHVLQILYKKLIANRNVREISQIEVKIQKNIFLYTGVSDFDTRDRDEFRFSRHMRLFCLIQ